MPYISLFLGGVGQRISPSKILSILLLLPLLLMGQVAVPAYAAGVVRFVVPGGLTTGACGTWANACSLQHALALAVSGDQLWVKQGTYKPGVVRTATYTLKNGVGIFGGFAGTETLFKQRNPTTNITILSGDIGIVGNAADNVYHVVTGGGTNSTAMLDGFTISHGNASGAYAIGSGGGMYNKDSSPTITNVTFSGNSASYGGGMFNDYSNPTLTNVTFSGDTAFEGGGLYNKYSNPTLTNGSFTGNSASDGGGLYNQNGNPLLLNVTFSTNTATSWGGGMKNSASSPVIVNATFNGNSANKYGGGIYNDKSSPGLYYVTFSGNSAKTTGGGMYDYDSSPIIYYSIFWSDGTEIINNLNDYSGYLTDSILSGGVCPYGMTCAYIINANPMLGPLANNGGYTRTMALEAGSAAIDTGSVYSTCGLTDQRGVARPQGGKCDLGAYEVKAMSFASAGVYDGWTLESSETSGIGGSINSNFTYLRVGDDASNRQYRSLLSFNTASLPDGAAVVLGRVRLRNVGTIGSNPFATHGLLLLDLNAPYFGTALGLQSVDFQATPDVSPAGIIGSALVSGWYAGSLTSAGRAAVNKTGTTQLRLRFSLDDNNDHLADYLALNTGDALTASYRPRLIVYYNP